MSWNKQLTLTWFFFCRTHNIFSFLSCIFLVCILFPCFIGIDKHVYSWKFSLSQLRRINLINFRFCTEFDTRLFFYPILINPFCDRKRKNQTWQIDPNSIFSLLKLLCKTENAYFKFKVITSELEKNFIGIDKHVYSWKSSLSQLRRINLIYFRFCTEFDTRLFFYPILINPFCDSGVEWTFVFPQANENAKDRKNIAL
jgi:hypothetical protein